MCIRMLVLLRFDRLLGTRRGSVGFYRGDEWVPFEEVWLRGDRIYLVLEDKTGYYVVYDVQNEQYLRAYRAEQVPPSARPVEKLEYKYYRCAVCGAEAEWDADELYCPNNPSHDEFEEAIETVYERKEFDWASVEKGEPVKDPRKTRVTERNAPYLFKMLTGLEPVSGYWSLAGHKAVVFAKVDKTQTWKIGPVEIEYTEGIGYVSISSWDSVPRSLSPGYYVSLTIRGARTRVYFAKKRDLDETELVAFVEGRLEDAVELLGREKVAKILAEHPEIARKKPAYTLAQLGLTSIARERLTQEIKKCKTLDCLDEAAGTLTLLGPEEAKEPRALLEQKLRILFSTTSNYRELRRLAEVAKKAGLDRLAEDARKKAQVVREKLLAMYRVKLPLEIARQLPAWADAGLIEASIYAYTVTPLKKSRYRRGEYYFSDKWRKISGETQIPVNEIIPVPAIVTKTGKIMPAQVDDTPRKYKTVKPKTRTDEEQLQPA